MKFLEDIDLKKYEGQVVQINIGEKYNPYKALIINGEPYLYTIKEIVYEEDKNINRPVLQFMKWRIDKRLKITRIERINGYLEKKIMSSYKDKSQTIGIDLVVDFIGENLFKK